MEGADELIHELRGHQLSLETLQTISSTRLRLMLCGSTSRPAASGCAGQIVLADGRHVPAALPAVEGRSADALVVGAPRTRFALVHGSAVGADCLEPARTASHRV